MCNYRLPLAGTARGIPEIDDLAVTLFDRAQCLFQLILVTVVCRVTVETGELPDDFMDIIDQVVTAATEKDRIPGIAITATHSLHQVRILGNLANFADGVAWTGAIHDNREFIKPHGEQQV